MIENGDLLAVDNPDRPPDPAQEIARKKLQAFFEARPEEVFFSRQLEVQNENEFFHWITNRAIKNLVDDGVIRTETKQLKSGGVIKLL